MKTLWSLTLLLIMCLPLTAQVRSEVSYNQDTKELTLLFTNELDEFIYLSPLNYLDPLATDLCWYEVWWKNQESKSILHRVPEAIFKSKAFGLPAKASHKFKIDLKTNKTDIKYVEIFFHIEIHTYGNQFRWKEEFTKTFEY